MKKNLSFVLGLLCWPVMAQQNMKREIPELPFLPSQAPVIHQERQGNIETITYLYQGKKYEERRLYMVEHHITEAGREKVRKLKDALGLDDQKAFEVHLILERCPWSKMPEKYRRKPFIQTDLAWELKGQIAGCLGTKEPAVIEKVLKLDLGREYPPMKDYIVRQRREEEAR